MAEIVCTKKPFEVKMASLWLEAFEIDLPWRKWLLMSGKQHFHELQDVLFFNTNLQIFGCFWFRMNPFSNKFLKLFTTDKLSYLCLSFQMAFQKHFHS